MCGRYSLICIDDLGNRFRVYNPMIGARSHFNISPGREMPVIIRDETDHIVPMRWGLVPHPAKDSAPSPKPINARAESLMDKPMFRPLLTSNRCLVPASGFFEWKQEGRRKVPFHFTVRDEPLFAFAGLYSTREGSDGTLLSTYTIITCPPNSLLAPVHDRMPVILTRENEDRWLSRAALSRDELARILAPYPARAMSGVRVSDRVNNPAADDESVVRPLGSSSGTQTLLTD